MLSSFSFTTILIEKAHIYMLGFFWRVSFSSEHGTRLGMPFHCIMLTCFALATRRRGCFLYAAWIVLGRYPLVSTMVQCFG